MTTKKGYRPVHPEKQMEVGKWFAPRTKSKLVKCSPWGLLGATLYCRLANWREWESSDPDYPPLFNREPLLVSRNVGLSTSIDVTDFSIRGYRFHAIVDEAEISIDRNAEDSGVEPSPNEWEYHIETGYYPGPPIDVYQYIQFAPYDYEDSETDVVHRVIQLYDYTHEFRARGWRPEEGAADGNLIFLSAGSTPTVDPIADALALQLETVPLSSCVEWTPLNPWARYVFWAPANASEDYCVVEVRG